MFRIPYSTYVEIEFVFSFYLHIPPSELNNMYFYDILYLYKRYEQHVTEENERQEQQATEYESQQEDYQMPKYDDMVSKITSQSNNFNVNTLINNAMSNMPKIG